MNYYSNSGNTTPRRGNGFFRNIQITYGKSTAVLLSDWSKTKITLGRKFNQNVFLLRCKRRSLIPHGIFNNSPKSLNFYNKYVNNLQDECNRKFAFQTLNLLIKDNTISIKKLKQKLDMFNFKIKQKLPHNVYSRFFEFEEKKAKFHFDQHKNRCKSKFENLSNVYIDSSLQNDKSSNVLTDTCFTNTTDVIIPDNVINTASLGKNFGIPFRKEKLPVHELISDIESNIHNIPEESRNNVRLKLVNCISNSTKNNNTRLKKPNCLQQQTIHNIKET